MTLRVGFGLVTAQLPPWAAHTVVDEYADALASARLVESLGFDAVWVSEHHVAEDSYLPSTLPLLAAMAAVTERVTLGTAIALAPFHHPLRFAEDCAVVDAISGGRLVVGLGAGWRKREFAAFDIGTSERVARTTELVRACRRAWGPMDAGDDQTAVTPKPTRPIPILLGGTAPAPIARAGRLADGYVGSPQNDLATFRAAVERFDRAALAAGRDPSTLSLALHVNAWVSRNGDIPAPVVQAMWHQIGTYARWHAEDDGAAPAAFPAVDLDRLRKRTLFGTSDEVVAHAAPWITEFADRELHFIVRLHYPGMRLADAEPTIRLFADEVIPRLRATAPAGPGAAAARAEQ